MRPVEPDDASHSSVPSPPFSAKNGVIRQDPRLEEKLRWRSVAEMVDIPRHPEIQLMAVPVLLRVIRRILPSALVRDP